MPLRADDHQSVDGCAHELYRRNGETILVFNDMGPKFAELAGKVSDAVTFFVSDEAHASNSGGARSETCKGRHRWHQVRNSDISISIPTRSSVRCHRGGVGRAIDVSIHLAQDVNYLLITLKDEDPNLQW